jgi:1,4-alpha-glucan branching enzyme
MKVLLRTLAPLVLVPLLAGCAGGWRGGVAPAQWAAGTPQTATTAAAFAAAPAVSGDAKGTHATADGALFVYRGEGGSVAVAGEFNSWSTSADPMKKQGDSWTLAKALPAGRYMYKFVVDGSNWKADPTATETADDGYGGKNAVVVVGGAAAATAPAAPAGAAAVAPATAAGTGPAVTTGGVMFRYSGTATSVNLAGEFNAWSTSADALKKQADGSWAITKALPAGRYMYKFVVDGSNWKEDPAAKETADDGYGGKNAVVVVGGTAAAATAPAAPAAAVAPAAAAAAPTPDAKPLAPGVKPRAPQAGANGVTFTYAGSARSAVALCGDFNAWATTTAPLKQQDDGSWTLTIKLQAGTYGYKFLVDGTTWKQDEGNPVSRDDGFGGKNSVVTVK